MARKTPARTAEDDGNTSLDLQRLFALSKRAPRPAWDRKFRLFACACWRQVWHLVTGEERLAVETAERYADGRAGFEELAPLRPLALGVASGYGDTAAWYAAMTSEGRLQRILYEARRGGRASWLGAEPGVRDWLKATSESQVTARGLLGKDRRALLREIFGNPLRPVTVEESWLRWNDGCVVKLARGIYDGQHWLDLPILADALLDAGCDSEQLLAHCRSAEGHTRGCWALDLLLGRG